MLPRFPEGARARLYGLQDLHRAANHVPAGRPHLCGELPLHDVRDAHEGSLPIVVSGCIGPRGDGYDPGDVMSPIEAETYHSPQIEAFANAGADMATTITATI